MSENSPFEKVVKQLADDQIDGIFNIWTIQDLLEEFGANATTLRSPNDVIKFFKARKANEQINWKNEIEKKAKTQRQKAIDQLEKEIEQKTRVHMKLQQVHLLCHTMASHLIHHMGLICQDRQQLLLLQSHGFLLANSRMI